MRPQNEKRELQASYNNTCRQYRIHLELTKAFSKNGIQLLMIENVLPQLEAETNKILSCTSNLLLKNQEKASLFAKNRRN